jgi:hypothetical protein
VRGRSQESGFRIRESEDISEWWEGGRQFKIQDSIIEIASAFKV